LRRLKRMPVTFSQHDIKSIAAPFGRIATINHGRRVAIEPCPFFGVCRLDTRRERFVPPAWLAEVNNAKIHQPSYAVTSGDILWQLDPETQLPFQSAGYSSEFEDAGSGRFRFSQQGRPTVHTERAVLLAGRVSYSYFHLAFETLPKLDLLKGFPEYANWPVIADDRLTAAPREMLKQAIGQTREVVWLAPEVDLLASRLVVMSSRAYLPDDPGLDMPAAVIHPGAVASLVDMFRADDPLTRAGKILWISRRKYTQLAISWGKVVRDIANSSEIDTLFESLDAEICMPESLSFSKQKKAFAEAEVVCMAAGSATTNLIFCLPGTKVLIISQDKNVNPGLLIAIAQACRLQLCWVFGPGIPSATPPAHWSFAVDPLNIRRGLDYLNGLGIEPDGFIPLS
jgi:capsular polysaccharide biosynthesis protein